METSKEQKNDSNEIGSVNHYRNGRKVTKEDFYLFCKIVLEHSNYDEMIKAESQNSNQIGDDSMDANGENSLENSSFEESDVNGTYDGDQFPEKNPMPVDGEDNTDSFNSITCYCNKPFAGRPMIECSQCLTWLHMSCAKVKRKNIPEFYYCEKCKAKGITGLSTTSSSSSNDESAGEKSSASSKAITKGTREFKVKQRKLKSNVMGKAKANTMFNRINGQISDKNENFYSPQKKQSTMNGKSFKMKKMRKLSQSLQAKSPAKKYLSRPGPAVLASATSRSSTVTSAVNSRIIDIADLVTERNGVDVTLRPSASPINQKSLANNNNHIYHTDLGIDLQPTTNGTETNPDIFSKRTKLS